MTEGPIHIHELEGKTRAQPPSTGLSPRLWLWLAVLVLVIVALGIPAYFAIRRLLPSAGTRAAGNPVIVASLRADFQPNEPKAGWHYYWNGNGAIGDSSAYEELRWNGKNNYVAGDAEHPAPTFGRFLYWSKGVGHPGQGPSQTFGTGDENEHSVVLAFSALKTGNYIIRDSYISRNDGARGGAVRLRVFAGQREVLPDLLPNARENFVRQGLGTAGGGRNHLHCNRAG